MATIENWHDYVFWGHFFAKKYYHFDIKHLETKIFTFFLQELCTLY